MRSPHLQRLLALMLATTMMVGCGAAPIENPTDSTPADTATQSGAVSALPAIPASFWTTSAPGVTSGYVLMPNGDQISKQCVFIQKPGEAPKKRPPCPIAPIKGKKFKQTLPVQPNTVVVEPAPSFEEVPLSLVVSEFSDYHTQPNLGWKSQYNVTGFRSQLVVPNSPVANAGCLYLTSEAEKWDGQYPNMTSLREVAGVILQWGNNGMWGGTIWSMFTYAADRSGNWNVGGPWYDIAPNTVVTFEGHSSHVNDPYWGSVTQWVLTANNDIRLTWNYPDPFDFNFFASTMQWPIASAIKRREYFPNANTIQWLSHFYTQPHGCTPYDEDYPVATWFCQDGDSTPNWKTIGNGGGVCSSPCPAGSPNGRWVGAAVSGGEPYDYNFYYQ